MNVATRSILGKWLLTALWAFCLGYVAAAQAAWWEFGRQDDEPVILDLKLNNVDTSRLVDRVVMSRDDLSNGMVVVRGRADVRSGSIGLVEYTLDGGRTWNTAKTGDRGFFTFDFRPQFEREYGVGVRALTTTGRATRLEDHLYRLEVKATNATDEVRRVFLQVLDYYRNENQSAFMRAVSEDFDGSIAALDDAVRNDFRNFDNIRIEPNIARISTLGENYEVYFTFNRQMFGIRNGRLLRDSAASTVTFKREGGTFKILKLATPLIFGVSNPEDVATTVTAQSVGTTVITVNPTTGTGTTQPLAASVPSSSSTGASSTIETGTITLTFSFTPPPPPPGTYSYQSFEFTNGGTKYPETTVPAAYAFTGNFMVAGLGNLFVKTPTQFRTCGMPYASLTTAPTTGYTPGGGAPLAGVATGQCYVFQLVGPKYAAIEVLSFTTVGCAGPTPCSNSLTFRYKYQTNGTTSLQ